MSKPRADSGQPHAGMRTVQFSADHSRLVVALVCLASLSLIVLAAVPSLCPAAVPFLHPIEVDADPENMLNHDEAVRVFEEQLEMHPKNPGLLNNLGVIHTKKNRPKRAVTMFEKALKQNPAYVKARLNLADALLALKRDQEARAELERIISHHAKTPEAKAAKERLESLR